MAILGSSSDVYTPMDLPKFLVRNQFLYMGGTSTSYNDASTNMWNAVNSYGIRVTDAPSVNSYNTLVEITGSRGELYNVITSTQLRDLANPPTWDIKITVDGQEYIMSGQCNAGSWTGYGRLVLGSLMLPAYVSYSSPFLPYAWGQMPTYNADNQYTNGGNFYIPDYLAHQYTNSPIVKFNSSLKIEMQQDTASLTGVHRYRGAQYRILGDEL